MADKNQLDTVKLRKLFPTEVWFLVLNFVTNYQDYFRVCGSATFLNNAIKTLTTRVLFADVLQVLQRQNQDKLKATVFNELLNLRSVCSAWKHSADGILHKLSISATCLSTAFYKTSDFHKYREHHPGNPFLGRRVCISVSPICADTSSYYLELMEMLRKFGHYILYCRLVFYIKNAAEARRFFKQLRSVLKLMPNLRRFSFCSIDEVPTELPLHMFPKLRHLQSISQNGMPIAVFQSLVRNNPQISLIQLVKETSRKELQTCLEQMPNLKYLHAVTIQPDVLLESQIVCRLRSLKLNLQETEISTCGAIFSTLEAQLGETLKILSLQLPDFWTSREDVTLRLRKLQTLTLTVQKPTNLDFILPLKDTLKYFRIHVREYETLADLQNNKIKFFKYQYRNKVCNSQIWDVFGKLQVLELGTWFDIIYVWTRLSRNQMTTKHYNEFWWITQFLKACPVKTKLELLVILSSLGMYLLLFIVFRQFS